MQGRLLPKVNNRYQAFPGKKWREEFYLAAKMGLDYIELIYEEDDKFENPLIGFDGFDQINETIFKTRVDVRSICADHFMKYPLYESNVKTFKQFENLIINSNKINVSEIVLPCIDISKLDTQKKKEDLINNLVKFKNLLANHKVTICLETDLNYNDNKEILESLDSQYFMLNYDTGNSASLGYNTYDELINNFNFISSYHIKDRKYLGGPVILGKGDYNFNTFFSLIEKKIINPEYLIIQAYRDDQGIDVFLGQYNWLKNKLNI